jgi:transcriptional regulator with XRE-family HTH domain
MILADKIIDLRKKQGWSQEELAEQLGVSRQSVSKWESGMSVPDLNKIIAMSELFGVSTDYLVKDTLEEPTPSETEARDTAAPARTVTAEEANDYMAAVEKHSKRIVLGVALCILSPILLILLASWGELGVIGMTEEVGCGIGLTALLLMIGVAVALFITNGLPLSRYEFLEEEEFSLAYGVAGIVERRQEQYRTRFVGMITVGVLLCIFSVIPLILVSILGGGEALQIGMLGLLLALCACGVSCIVRACYINGSFQRLLRTGDFAPKKTKSSRSEAVYEAITGAYWCLVTGGYLLWSFLTGDWHITWIIWVIAPAGQGVIEALLGKRS